MEFLIGSGSSVAADAGNSILARIKKHIGYLFNYKSNMKSLEDARVDLEAKRNDASRLGADATTKFKDVSSTVTRWWNEAEKVHKQAERIIVEANNRRSSCFHPWWRYSSSKTAGELTQEINEKVQSAPDFGTTFDCPAPESGLSFNLAGVIEFESRLSVLKGLLEALKDEKVSMCSICGMGGVGKTTLAKKLIQRVETLHLFDKSAMITVSDNPNFEKIQSEIIQLLGLKMDETAMPARANRLHYWLTNNKTLLILDDVWTMLTCENFQAIGIPYDSKACKTLFTSRNEDECKKMGSQCNFSVGVLDDGEAWDMFKKFAGECAEDLNICGIAKNIADECGGLPIAIVTIATTLKDKSEGIWSNSLRQLQNSNLSGISDMEKVYSRIKLSYDLLQDKEAQSCFRLCCLYPEDYNIPIEDLVLYGKGLNLFEGVNTMKEARDRVEWIVYKLKTTFLLLDGDEYESVKMHDIVRDFAVSFSSEAEEDPYIIECVGRKWPETTTKYRNCSTISTMSTKMPELDAVDLEFPKLELLQLGKYSNLLKAEILGKMKELKFISLKIPSLSEPLTVPKKLRGLFVKETRMYLFGRQPRQGIEVMIGDDMMNLEYFSVSSRRHKAFPMEIGILCNLRFLRLSSVNFRYIPPGVLPKLVKLEELYLSWNFVEWGRTDMGRSRTNASFEEINSLPLTALEVAVPDGSVLADKMVKNLTRFQIHVGGSGFCNDYMERDFNSKTALHVHKVDSTASWISGLVRKSESLSFIQVKDLKINNNNGFEQSKKIRICESEEMEYFVDRSSSSSDDQQNIPRTSRSFSRLEILELRWLYNLKEICHNVSKIEAPLLFRNLIELGIHRCVKLKSAFPLTVAKGLSQLQRIDITECDEMEKVFYTDDDMNQKEAIAQTFCQSTPDHQITTSNFDTNNHQKANLSCPTPNSLIRGLLGRQKHPESVPNQQQVEENGTKVSDDGKQVDVTKKSDENRAILFPRLKFLYLRRMPTLRVFYDGNDAIELPSLESLRTESCEKMEVFSYGSCTAPILQQILINEDSHPIAEEDVNAFFKHIMLNHEKPDTGDDMKKEKDEVEETEKVQS